MGEIQRPLFFEGQILAARDLQESVEYARGKDHRHNRLAHLWGIASGLDLVVTARQTTTGEAYVDVTATAGVAIDSSGRELLLAADTRLAPERFRAANVEVEDPDDDPWYPVYLTGRDRSTGNASATLGGCGSGTRLPTRAVENASIDYRRPGAFPDAPADPPLGEEATTAGAPILLGFVQWNAALGQFTAAAPAAGGVERRRVGVRASVVESSSGSLELRTNAADVVGAPAVVVDSGAFRFGLQDGAGKLTDLFTVNKKGEVTAGGRPLGGGVRKTSGLLMHGMRVPLPANVTEDAVESEAVTLHITVVPHLDFPRGGVEVVLPVRCMVDADRRLHCLWWEIPSFDIRPGIARYTVTATVVGAEESS